MLSSRLPKLVLGEAIPATNLSHDPRVVDCYECDPLNWHGAMRARLAAEVLNFLARVDDTAAALRMPFLVLHGEADRICPVSGSKRFFELLGSSAGEKKLVTYPGLFHEIFNEPREQDPETKVNQPIREVVAFFSKHAF